MDIALAISGVLTERNALQQSDGLYLPSYISEHMQALAQYTSALEETLGEEEKRITIEETKLFNAYRNKKMSVNASQVQIKYDLAADKAELDRLSRLCASSWRFISVSQSRINHLLKEAQNQI